MSTLCFPFIEAAMRVGTEQFYNMCDSFDPVAHLGFHDRFTTYFPLLALAGLNDKQTDGTAANYMAEILPGMQAATFPETGHGTLLCSHSTVDIAVSFIERPEEPVNGECAEHLKPEFYVP